MSNPRWTDDEMRETLDASAEKSRQITRLRAENEQLKTSGIAEVAAHNPSVMDRINHWEGRTLKAEAENEKLRSALKSCIAMLEQLGYTPISKVARAALEGK